MLRFIYPESGDSGFFRNIDVFISKYTASLFYPDDTTTATSKTSIFVCQTTSFHFRPEDGSKILIVGCCTSPHGSVLQNRSTFSTAVRTSDLESRRCKKCQLNLRWLVSTVQRGRRPDWHANLEGLRDVRRPDLDEITTFKKFWASGIFFSIKILEVKEKIR